MYLYVDNIQVILKVLWKILLSFFNSLFLWDYSELSSLCPSWFITLPRPLIFHTYSSYNVFLMQFAIHLLLSSMSVTLYVSQSYFCANKRKLEKRPSNYLLHKVWICFSCVGFWPSEQYACAIEYNFCSEQFLVKVVTCVAVI